MISLCLNPTLILYFLTCINSWVETIEISETGCKDAVQRVYHGKGRYRVTLVGYDKVFNTSE